MTGSERVLPIGRSGQGRCCSQQAPDGVTATTTRQCRFWRFTLLACGSGPTTFVFDADADQDEQPAPTQELFGVHLLMDGSAYP